MEGRNEGKKSDMLLSDSGLDPKVANPHKFKETISGASRENTRAVLEGLFHVPERFRGAISSMMDNLPMGAYEVALDYDMDGPSAHFHVDIKQLESKDGVSVDGRDPLSPLGQATLPYKEPESERMKNMPKTAEERDSKVKAKAA